MKYRGANIVLRKQPRVDDMKDLLITLRKHGANAVAFNTIHFVYLQPGTTDLGRPPAGWYPPWYIYPDIGQDPSHPFNDTVDINRVYGFVRMARDLGFERILIKPMIDSQFGEWRGSITVPKNQEGNWIWGYKHRLLEPYLPLVKEFKADLCLGTEFVKINEQLGAGPWIDMVEFVRSLGVTSRLTFAANHGWENGAEYMLLKKLWPHLQFIGIDAYWKMVNEGYKGPITKELLLNGESLNIGWSRRMADANGHPEAWCPPIDEHIKTLALDTQLPIWFTEIGYPHNILAPLDPPGTKQGEPRTLAYSLPLAQAAREKWDNFLEGWYWWDAGYKTAGMADSSHNLIGTPLADVVLGP